MIKFKTLGAGLGLAFCLSCPALGQDQIILPGGVVIDVNDIFSATDAQGRSIFDEGVLERSIRSVPEIDRAITETEAMMRSPEFQRELERGKEVEDAESIEELSALLEQRLGAEAGSASAKQAETKALLDEYATNEKMAEAEAKSDTMEQIVAELDDLNAEIGAIIESGRAPTESEQAAFTRRSKALEKRMMVVLGSE